MRSPLPIVLASLVVLVLTIGALMTSGDLGTTNAPQAAAVEVEVELPENRDTQLYREVIRRVQSGQNYYEAASQLHRERSYPLYPFITVRPPTLAMASAHFGSTGLFVVAWGLLVVAIVVWLRALSGYSVIVRASAAGLLALGGASTITPAGIALHEFWCGLLLSIALGLSREKDWIWRLAFAATALAIREFAVLFILAIGFFALLGRRWMEVAAVATVVVVFAGFLAAHYIAVADVRLATDLQSPPWTGMRGPSALVADLSRISWLSLLPWSIAAIITFLPLIGWVASPRPWLALVWFVGFGATIAIFARPNNEYWVLALLPAYLLGLALLGPAVRRIVSNRKGKSSEEHSRLV